MKYVAFINLLGLEKDSEKNFLRIWWLFYWN